ncbi:ATP-binding protein [Aliikangiella maris]|uniref:histidine kinase n=2 Tax=Aliikangiella maris TaxID=3162458 RepID=A0ABV2BUZ3_9GAMM
MAAYAAFYTIKSCGHLVCDKGIFIVRNVHMIRQIALVLIFWISSANAEPINYSYLLYTLENGLCSTTVKTFLRDSRGILWIGSEEGLCRWDGHTFNPVPLKSAATSNITMPMIRGITELPNGKLLIAFGAKQLGVLNPVSEKFTEIDVSKFEFLGISKFSSRTLPNGRWFTFGKESGVWFFDYQSMKFYEFAPQYFSDKTIINLMINQQSIFISTNKHLFHFDPQGHLLNKVSADDRLRFESVDGAGNLWAVINAMDSPDGVSRVIVFDQQLKKISELKIGKIPFYIRPAKDGTMLMLEAGSISSLSTLQLKARQDDQWLIEKTPIELSIYFDEDLLLTEAGNDGKLIFRSFDQLGFYNSTTGKIDLFRLPYSSDRDAFSANYFDSDGSLWVALSGRGILNIRFNRPFHKYLSSSKASFDSRNTVAEKNIGQSSETANVTFPLLPANSVRGFFKDDKGGLWVCSSDNGVYYQKNKMSDWVELSTVPFPLRDIRRVIVDNLGQLWLASNIDGLIVKQTAAPIWKKIANTSTDESQYFNFRMPITEVLEDGDYILAAGRSLMKINKKTTLTVKAHALPNSARARGLFKDSHGNIWISTHGAGLQIFDSFTENFDTLTSHDIDNTYFFSVTEDRFGQMFVVSFGQGIWVFNRTRNLIKKITITEGLLSNTVWSAITDQTGDVWVGTPKGLNRIKSCDMALADCNLEIFSFNEHDGLRGIEFDSESAYVAEDGELFFGGLGGFVRFYPEDVLINKVAPQIHYSFGTLNGIRLRNIQDQRLNNDQTGNISLILNHSDTLLELNFYLDDVIATPKQQFKYRKLGQTQWIDLGNKPKLTFALLEPGRQVIEVLGANSDGIWSESPLQITLYVEPPWWQTEYAYFGYGLFLLFFIAFYLRSKQKRLKAINLELEQTVSLRTKELAQVLDDKQKLFENLSHELRTPLTLILGPIDNVLKQKLPDNINQQIKGVKHQGEKLLYLVEQLLALAEVHAHNHKTEIVDIKQLTTTVVDGLRILADENQAKIELINIETPLSFKLIQHAWQTILTNLITNAIKHSPDGAQVSVSLSYKDDALMLEVNDQGSGIDEDKMEKIFRRFYKMPGNIKQGSGIGLALTKELVESMQGKINVKSDGSKGCTFIVILPLQPIESPSITESIKESSPLPYITINTTSKALVLLVEDEPELQDYTASLLREEFEVITADNGKEALEKLQGKLPQLIISDVMMPEMDGYELAAKVKNTRELRHIPFILLTAKSDLQSQKRGYQMKADDYIGKPFSPEILLMKSVNLVASFNAQQEYIKQHFYQRNFKIEKVENKELRFMQELDTALNDHFADSKVKIETIASQLNMEKRALARYTEKLLSQSPGQVLREFRLMRAMEMLKAGHNVTQTCFDCGFNSVAYFGSCFKEQFGQVPSSIDSDISDTR